MTGTDDVSGGTIDDDLVDQMGAEAEAGYDVDEIINRRSSCGRPRLGPELKERLTLRGAEEAVAISEVIRDAL